MLGDSIRRHLRMTRGAPRLVDPTARMRWERWVLSGFIAVLLSFGAGYLIAAQVLFPAPEAPSEDATVIPVPRLLGKELTMAQEEIEALGLTVGGVRWLPHPEAPAGTIIAQDPLPDQRLRAGGEVRLAISSGRAQARVPDVVGLPYEAAARLAEGLGFDVNRRAQPETGVPAGYVLDVHPRPGTERVLPASITLVVSAKPAVVPNSVQTPGPSFDVPLDTPIVPRTTGAAASGGSGN
ncbi:MAG TPA: PASTA domain-containing protein [Longimicrobiales bacterium]